MLLENIFAASLCLFCLMLVIAITPQQYLHSLLSFLFYSSMIATIITAIWWIVRAWG